MPSPAPLPLSLATALAEDSSASADGDPAQWALLLAAVGGFSLAALGAIAASSLLVYSPAKLARMLNGRGDQLIPQLAQHRAGYHALARSLAMTGLLTAGVLLWATTAGTSRGLMMSGFVVLTLVFCGVLPGAVAAERAEQVVAATTPTLELLRRMLHYPVVMPLLTIAHWILRAFRIKPTGLNDEEITEEILAAVEDKANETGLDAEERSWIGNIIDLKDTDAAEIMTPRTDITAFDRDLSLHEAVKQATEAGFSRFPVYQGKVDNVVGVFYAKDVLPLLINGQADEATTVGDHMREPLFVPESIEIVDLLRQFRTSRVQMAIVLDEYGGTSGLVSIEDVLEEIVGDITDEYDDAEIPIKVIDAGRTVESSGRVRIVDINEVLPVPIPEAEDYDTVAGFVFTSLDRIPKVNEAVDIGGFECEVLEGDDRRIHRLRVTVSKAPTDA